MKKKGKKRSLIHSEMIFKNFIFSDGEHLLPVYGLIIFCIVSRAFELLNSRSRSSKDRPPLSSEYLAEQLESMSIIGNRIFDLELPSGMSVSEGGRWMSTTLLPFTLKSIAQLASDIVDIKVT